MSELLTNLAVSAGIVGGGYALGQALDHVATDKLKDTVVQLVRKPRHSSVSTAIESAVDIYHKLFSYRITSFSFLLNSFYFYSLVFAGLALGLYFSNQAVFYSAFSGVFYGDIESRIYSIAIYLFCFILFTISNAQTLFFLRLIKFDPRLVSSALVMYADLLLTSSICVIGVGILVFALSATAKYEMTRARVQYQVLSKDMDGSPSSRAIISNAERKQYLGSDDLLLISLPIPSRDAIYRRAKDMDTVRYLYPRNNNPRIIITGPTTHQFINSNKDVINYQDAGLDAGYNALYISTDMTTAQQICRDVLSTKTQRNMRVNLTNVTLSPSAQERCIHGLPFSATADVSINFKSVSVANLFRDSLSFSASVLASDLSGHFESVFTYSPISAYESSSPWQHTRYISEVRSKTGQVGRDDAFLTIHLRNLGYRSIFLVKNYPIGTLISSVLFSSVFSIILFLAALSSVIFAKILVSFHIVTSYTKLEDYPFSILASSGAFVIGLLIIISEYM